MKLNNLTDYQRGQLIAIAIIYCELVLSDNPVLPLNIPVKGDINWIENKVANQLKHYIQDITQDDGWNVTDSQLFTIASTLVWTAEGYMPTKNK